MEIAKKILYVLGALAFIPLKLLLLSMMILTIPCGEQAIENRISLFELLLDELYVKIVILRFLMMTQGEIKLKWNLNGICHFVMILDNIKKTKCNKKERKEINHKIQYKKQ